MARCKVCGEAHAACGPSTVATVVPIDERVTLRKEGHVGELKRYEVEIPGRGGRVQKTTLLLSDEDAKAQGLTKPSKGGPGNTADKPANKSAKPQGEK